MAVLVTYENENFWRIECGGLDCGIALEVPKWVELPREYFDGKPLQRIQKNIMDYEGIMCKTCIEKKSKVAVA